MILQQYLDKHAFKPPYFSSNPAHGLKLLVVIPAHDEKSLVPSLASLQRCDVPQGGVEVIVVFNASEESHQEVIARNEGAKKEAQAWYDQLQAPLFTLLIIEENQLPKKHAGVGLARKIGMDEAVRRFLKLQQTDGVVVCFDADSLCEANYLVEIEHHFKQHPNTSACSIHFEHPIEGKDFEQAIYDGIAHYELHLRYYKNGLAYAGLPYAYHTIGSSMAVRVKDYCKQGGMNRRKAGEDFYFLQKFIDLGSFSEIHSTKVIPSPRQSDRVPFGTGRAIKEMLHDQREIEKSYAFEIFPVLLSCFAKVRQWYSTKPQYDQHLLAFMGREKLDAKWKEIKRQSSSEDRFVKRFFLWFNAFQLLKFVHFLRDEYYPNEALIHSAPKLLQALQHPVGDDLTTPQLLEQYRAVDQKRLKV